MDAVFEMVQAQRDENQKLMSQVKKKMPSIKSFFPLPDSDTLDRFLDDSDGMFEHRVSQFEDLMMLYVSDKKGQFGTAILNALFSKEYIMTHRWPTNG